MFHRTPVTSLHSLSDRQTQGGGHMNPLSPPISNRLNITITLLLQEWLWHVIFLSPSTATCGCFPHPFLLLLLSFLFRCSFSSLYFPSSLTKACHQNDHLVSFYPHLFTHNALHSPIRSHFALILVFLSVTVHQQSLLDHMSNINMSVRTFWPQNKTNISNQEEQQPKGILHLNDLHQWMTITDRIFGKT